MTLLVRSLMLKHDLVRKCEEEVNPGSSLVQGLALFGLGMSRVKLTKFLRCAPLVIELYVFRGLCE